MKTFNRPSADPTITDVIIGCHSVGDQGHGSGPSIAFFNPLRLTFQIRPSNFFSIEFFAYTAAPEWGGRKVRIPLEDDAVVNGGSVVAAGARVGKDAVVNGTVLMRDVVVGDGAHLLDCVVGPGARIGAGIELKGVTVGDGAVVDQAVEPGTRVPVGA